MQGIEAAPRPAPGMIRRAVAASVIGNGLEWFDFLSYAFFAQIIARNFFPARVPGLSLLLTFAVFALGFVVRPLGGLLLGLYADRAGRRPALVLLLGMMAVGTLLIGLAPTYAEIGLAAPLLVLLARLLQGLSAGGEFGSAAAMLTEYAPPGRRMFYGSFQMSSQGVALLLASLFGYVLQRSLSPAAMTEWGWRVPFLAGCLIGPIGLYIRAGVAESPVFAQLAASRAAPAPVLRGLAAEWRAIVCGIGVIAVGTALNYLWHNYTPTYVVRELHLPREAALLSLSICGALAIVAYPVAGWVADRVGAFRMFFPVVIAFALAAWPLYAYVAAAPDLGRLLAAEIVATLFLAAMSGPHPGMLSMLFPASSRSTGVSLSYNVAVLLFGGLAPLTVTGLLDATGDRMVPAYYQIATAAISLVLVGATASTWRRASEDAARPAGRA